jgi:primosomal protein N'
MTAWNTGDYPTGRKLASDKPSDWQARYDCVDAKCSMRGVLRRDVDEPFLAYLERVVFDVTATREAIAQEHSRRSAESAALLADAERELSQTEASLARVKADYVRGALAAEDWRELRRELTEQREAAEREIERLRARAAEAESEVAAFDLDEEAAQKLAALRHAITGEVVGAAGLAAIRSALGRVFSKVTLVRTPEGELVLIPEVAAFDEVETWVRLPDGRAAVKPLPARYGGAG